MLAGRGVLLSSTAGYGTVWRIPSRSDRWRRTAANRPRNKPNHVIGFYSVIAAATPFGIGIDWSPPDHLKALFWAAVVDGVAVASLMAMMVVVTRSSLMGGSTAGGP